MTRQRLNTASSGFATVSALTLLAFVAVLLSALGAWIGMDARRSREASTDAQLRQLLHAGAVAASDDGMAVGTTNLPLPANLDVDSARVTIAVASSSATEQTAMIESAVGARHARQSVRFARRGERWVATSATLDPE